jgi:hypothetical protein
MKKQTKNTPSVVLSSPAAVVSGFTIGLDLGDRSHYVCVLDATGQILHEGPMLNDRVALTLLLTQYPAATVALEAGTHSPWISRYLNHSRSLLTTLIAARGCRRSSPKHPAMDGSCPAEDGEAPDSGRRSAPSSTFNPQPGRAALHQTGFL